MTLAELRAASRRKTKTTASNYPDATLDADINLAYGKVWLMLQEAEGYRNTGGDWETIDFEDNEGLGEQDLGYNGEYPFPVFNASPGAAGAISVIEVHVDYGDGYKKAEIVNRSNLEASQFSDDDDYYSASSPKVFIFRDSIFIRPRNTTGDTIEDGIKVLTISRQPDLEEDDDEPMFEKNLHELIAYYVALAYYELYPEKYNARVEKGCKELEAQAISLYESRVPIVKRLTGVKERY